MANHKRNRVSCWNGGSVAEKRRNDQSEDITAGDDVVDKDVTKIGPPSD